MTPNQDHSDIRNAVRALCAAYPDEYFRAIDAQRGYPEAFVDALMRAGWLAAMIPEEYGGAGLGLAAASVIMEEINRCGANAGAVHGQMYNMGTLLRNGTREQKQRYLPQIAAGELRIQSMAVTEPTTGTDTTKLKTTAVRRGDRYIVNGQKVWTSRVQHSDLMVLLARTTPLTEVKRKSDGMSVFIVDLRESIGHGLTVRPIANMVNHETNELFFDCLLYTSTTTTSPQNALPASAAKARRSHRATWRLPAACRADASSSPPTVPIPIAASSGAFTRCRAMQTPMSFQAHWSPTIREGSSTAS